MACLGPVAAAWGQTVAPDPVEVAAETAAASSQSEPTLDRVQWVVLLWILGEQLPDEVTLTGLTFDVAPADVRIRVRVPTETAEVHQTEMTLNLLRYFDSVEPGPFVGSAGAAFLEGEVTLSGLPTREQYRDRKEGGVETPSPAGESAPDAPPPAPVPAPAVPSPAPAVTPVSTPGQQPAARLRRVSEPIPGGGYVAHVEVGGREYLARQGRAFANQQFLFVGPAPPAPEAPDIPCITIEQRATGERSTICAEP